MVKVMNGRMGKILLETGGTAGMVTGEKARDCCQKRSKAAGETHLKEESWGAAER